MLNLVSSNHIAHKHSTTGFHVFTGVCLLIRVPLVPGPRSSGGWGTWSLVIGPLLGGVRVPLVLSLVLSKIVLSKTVLLAVPHQHRTEGTTPWHDTVNPLPGQGVFPRQDMVSPSHNRNYSPHPGIPSPDKRASLAVTQEDFLVF